MINLKDTQIKNKLEEMTIKEFETITSIINTPSEDYIERWSKVLVSLGARESEVDSLSIDEFIEIVRSFEIGKGIETNLKKEFELEGYTYRAYDEEFILRVKDLNLIEKCIKQKKDNYLSHLIAILFKRTDLSNAEHYANAHIEHKAKLFSALPVTDFYSYIHYIGEKLSTKLEISNANS